MKATSQKRVDRGFALVATLLMMVLLMLIAVAMLSLSSVTTRSIGIDNHQRIAMANARMAAMIALGELQEYAGPDQRVTANASIHGGVHPSKRHLMGVWSTEGWNPKNPDTKKLLTWLATVPIADPNAAKLSDITSEITDFGVEGSKVISIVDEGSLGSEATEQDIVKIATIPVKNQDGKLKGSYGYWTSGLASRASYAVPVEASPSDWNKASSIGVAGKTGIEVLDSSFVDNQKIMEANTVARDSPSYETLDLIFPSDDKPSANYFHDLTNRSISLLTNTRDGGLKSDLSTAFELDLGEFNAIEEFHNSKERNLTNNYVNLNDAVYNQPEFYPSSHPLGYLFEVPYNNDPASGVMRGPTWDLLRNHYRIYKRDWENLSWPRAFTASDTAVATRGALPLSYSAFASNNTMNGRFGYRPGPGLMFRSTSRNEGHRQQALPKYEGEIAIGTATAPRVAPMLIRVTMVVGLRKIPTGSPAPNDWLIGISLDPYLTIMNPYNRPIEFESVGTYSHKFNPLRFNVEWTDDSGVVQKAENLMFSSNLNNAGALVYRMLPPPGGGTHRLEPGEIKVLTPQPVGGNPQAFSIYAPNFVEADFNYAEDTGLYVRLGRVYYYPAIKPRSGTTITMDIFGRFRDSNEKDLLTFTEFRSKDHKGVSVDLKTHLPPWNIQGTQDIFDDSHITSLLYDTFQYLTLAECKNHRLYNQVKINESSIPDVGDSGHYFGALDMRLKHGEEDAPVFHQFNPRAQAFDSREYDCGSSISPAWSMELKKINDVSELNLVADPEGRAFWGSGTDAFSGTKKVVLFELPRTPATSLAALTHADTGILATNASYAIANSFTNPGIRSTTDIIGRRARTTTAPVLYSIQQPQILADFSWAANEAIYDQFFFSGINWGSANLAHETGSQKYSTQDAAIVALKENKTGVDAALANPRIKYSPIENSSLDSELKDYSKIAKHLSVVGGFNVNSTSVNAWRAVLSALKKSDVRYLNDSGQVVSKEANVPFSRFMMPSGDSTDKWAGFRDLTDDEITQLAEAIVEQVKTRGPFMGMSDFVNRRLTTGEKDGSEIGKLGALQMAIEKAGLNDALSNNVTLGEVENKSIKAAGKTLTHSTMAGAPGYLMQSDILNTIGSILTTRSDTFTIRAYGESIDAQGNVAAKAWCELTVQRTPEWMSPTDIPFKIPDSAYPDYSTQTIVKRWANNPEFPEINKKYGRRMEIVSFKWLNPNEI